MNEYINALNFYVSSFIITWFETLSPLFYVAEEGTVSSKVLAWRRVLFFIELDLSI